MTFVLEFINIPQWTKNITALDHLYVTNPSVLAVENDYSNLVDLLLFDLTLKREDIVSRVIKNTGSTKFDNILFLYLPDYSDYGDYGGSTWTDPIEVKKFSKSVLSILAQEKEDTIHVAMEFIATQDLERAVLSQISGITEAIQSGEFPKKLQRITLFMNHEFQRNHVRNILDTFARNFKIITKDEKNQWIYYFEYETTDKPKVFISYSSKDETLVSEIEKELNNNGIATWRDKKDIYVGEPILDKVKKGIWDDCDYSLVFLSQNSINSNWCKSEIRMAYEKEMTTGEVFLLSVLIDNCDVPKELSIKKYLDLNKNPDDIKQLIEGIFIHHSKKIKSN